MPGRNGTGPMGQGCYTGRGLGRANNGGNTAYFGRGAGFQRGFGRGMGYGYNNYSNTQSDDFLKEEKKALEDRINFINSQLEKK